MCQSGLPKILDPWKAPWKAQRTVQASNFIVEGIVNDDCFPLMMHADFLSIHSSYRSCTGEMCFLIEWRIGSQMRNLRFMLYRNKNQSLQWPYKTCRFFASIVKLVFFLYSVVHEQNASWALGRNKVQERSRKRVVPCTCPRQLCLASHVCSVDAFHIQDVSPLKHLRNDRNLKVNGMKGHLTQPHIL